MHFYAPDCNKVEIEKSKKNKKTKTKSKQNKQKGFEKSLIEIDQTYSNKQYRLHQFAT